MEIAPAGRYAPPHSLLKDPVRLMFPGQTAAADTPGLTFASGARVFTSVRPSTPQERTIKDSRQSQVDQAPGYARHIELWPVGLVFGVPGSFVYPERIEAIDPLDDFLQGQMRHGHSPRGDDLHYANSTALFQYSECRRANLGHQPR
jgi:hypothetical protein